MREKFRDQFFRAWKIEGDKLFSDTKSSFKSGEKKCCCSTGSESGISQNVSERPK